MARIDGPKYTGPMVIDVTEFADELIDLPPRGLQGARTQKEGLDEVFEELATAVPNHGEEAELHPAVYARVLSETAVIDRLRVFEVALEKLLEVCRETRGAKENNREDDLSAIATQAAAKADRGRNPGLRAHFEKTIRYKTAFARRSVATRRRNEDARDDAGDQQADDAPVEARATR